MHLTCHTTSCTHQARASGCAPASRRTSRSSTLVRPDASTASQHPPTQSCTTSHKSKARSPFGSSWFMLSSALCTSGKTKRESEDVFVSFASFACCLTISKSSRCHRHPRTSTTQVRDEQRDCKPACELSAPSASSCPAHSLSSVPQSSHCHQQHQRHEAWC